MTTTMTELDARLAALAEAEGMTPEDLAERLLADAAAQLEAEHEERRRVAEEQAHAARMTRWRKALEVLRDLRTEHATWPAVPRAAVAVRVDAATIEELLEAGAVTGNDLVLVVRPTLATLAMARCLAGPNGDGRPTVTWRELLDFGLLDRAELDAAVWALQAMAHVDVRTGGDGAHRTGWEPRGVAALVVHDRLGDDRSTAVRVLEGLAGGDEPSIPVARAREALRAAGVHDVDRALVAAVVAGVVDLVDLPGRADPKPSELLSVPSRTKALPRRGVTLRPAAARPSLPIERLLAAADGLAPIDLAVALSVAGRHALEDET